MMIFLIVVITQTKKDVIKRTTDAISKFRHLYYLSYKDPRIQDIMIEFLKEKIEEYPDIIQLHRLYQNELLKVNKDTLIKEYKELFEQHPDNPKYIYLYARIIKDTILERKLAKELIEKYPDFYWGYIMKAYAYYIQKETSEAEKFLYKAIAIDSTIPTAYYLLFLNTLTKGDTSNALKYWTKYYQLYPEDQDTRWRIYSYVEYQLKRQREKYKKEILNIKRTLAMSLYQGEDLNVAMHYLLDYIYELALEQMKDSVEYYLPLIEKFPYFTSNKSPEVLYKKWVILDVLGRERKRDSLSSLLFTKPDRRLCRIFSNFGKEMPYYLRDRFIHFFINYFKKKERLTKKDSSICNYLTFVFSELIYNVSEKEKIFETMLELGEKTGVKQFKKYAYYHWACIKAKNGEKDSAFFYLEKASVHGYAEKAHIIEDPDLVEIRKDKRFEKILQEIEKNMEEKVLKEIEKARENKKPLENFRIITLNKDTTDIYSFKKRPLLIEFYGIGCGWCEVALKNLKEIKKEFPHLAIALINIWKDQPYEIKNYIKKKM